ncbi:MAG: hypothetical protein Q8Q23_01075 [bacterium]|nr:hypothetical protein [bacterium]
METKKFEDLNKGDQIKADLYSRPNAMNGKYRAAQIGLDDLAGIKSKDIFFLETLKVRADSADKMIAEAESQGKDTKDPEVIKELGEEINALGKPIHRSESVMTAIMNTIRLMITYGITIGIWGLVFKKSFLTFGLYGTIAGLLISLLFIAPVTVSQRTKERIKDTSFGASLMLVTPVIYIGIAGLVVWIIRLIFFN